MTHVELLEKYLKYLEIISLDVQESESAKKSMEGQQQSIKFIIRLLKNPTMLDCFTKNIDSVINSYEEGE